MVWHAEGPFELSHLDEVIDKMIVGDYLFDISLPHIPSRCLSWSNPSFAQWESPSSRDYSFNPTAP